MTKTRSYFARDAAGLKADIARHRAREQELLQKIAECGDDEYGRAFAAAYQDCLAALLQSKAEVVSKIGVRK